MVRGCWMLNAVWNISCKAGSSAGAGFSSVKRRTNPGCVKLWSSVLELWSSQCSSHFWTIIHPRTMAAWSSAAAWVKYRGTQRQRAGAGTWGGEVVKNLFNFPKFWATTLWFVFKKETGLTYIEHNVSCVGNKKTTFRKDNGDTDIMIVKRIHLKTPIKASPRP